MYSKSNGRKVGRERKRISCRHGPLGLELYCLTVQTKNFSANNKLVAFNQWCICDMGGLSTQLVSTVVLVLGLFYNFFYKLLMWEVVIEK